MNLNQMYYYVTVCQCQSFSKAAEEIYVSQPALSKQIAALESELGQQLILRRTRGAFSLTPAGEAYLKSFQKIIREFEETRAQTSLAAGQGRRHYRIGLMESWLLHDLMQKCTAAAKAFPDTELEFLFLRPGEMTARRQAGKLDLALLRDDVNWPLDTWCWEKLRDIEGLLYVSAQNPCIEDGDIQILRLKNEPLFGPPGREMLNADGHRIFRIMGDRSLTICEREELASIRMGILSTNGYSFADAWSDVLYNPLFCVKRLPDMRRDVILSWRLGDDRPLTQALCACIRAWVQNPCFPL